MSRDNRKLVREEAGRVDENLVALLDAEERYGGQAAAIEAEPHLAAYAPMLQRVRGKIAAAALGVERRGDGRPFPPEVMAEASRVFTRVMRLHVGEHEDDE